MREALKEASFSGDDVPVGAVIVDRQGQIVSKAPNRREQKLDPSAHAEVEAIRGAAKILRNWRLNDLSMVVTLEPCVMCAGIIRQSRIHRVVFGAFDLHEGAGGSKFDILRDSALGTPIEVIGGVLSEECGELLRGFFRNVR